MAAEAWPTMTAHASGGRSLSRLGARMQRSRRLFGFSASLLLAAVASLTYWVASAFATSGYYHKGWTGAGPNAFCAPSGGCDGDAKTRDGHASWSTGRWGYTGAYRPGVGWEAYGRNISGYYQWSTYTNVEAQCGNSSSSAQSLSCWTNNL